MSNTDGMLPGAAVVDPLPDGARLIARPLSDRLTIEPTPGRICVRVAKQSDVTRAGLILPPKAMQGSMKNRATQGEIVAVGSHTEDFTDGEGRIWKPMFSVGDTILFGQYSGIDIEVGDQSYVLLNESDVLARVTDGSVRIKVKS